MNIRILLALLLILAGCTRSEAPSVRTLQQPIVAVAERLNARYANTVSSCPGGVPAYDCSGVLFRRVTYNPGYDFWGHSASAIRLGSSTFSYIRNGVSSSSADVTSGYILMDPASARAAGKKVLTPRCIFPFMADTQANSRAMHGCGFANRPSPDPLPADLSNCATLAVPAVTAAAWVQNFSEHGANITNQCSLSTKVAEQFATSLAVRASFPDLTRVYGNEMLYELWDTGAPEQLPIEAIFYNASKEGSLINAQALKHAYQVKTNIELPIVRLDFGTGAKRFVLRDLDQEDGWAVARRLNERHANTTVKCPDEKAAVYCSGILVRAASYRTSYHAWDPNVASSPAGATSLSYLRGDIKTQALFANKPQGVIFKDLDSVPAGLEPMQALCIYMADADTWERADKGCGANSNSPTPGTESCASQGITTLDQLRAHWLAAPVSPSWQRLHHQCSLAISPAPFMLAIEGRRQNITGTESRFYQYNEIMIANWSMNAPQYVDGIYYEAGNAEGLRQAKEIQKDIMRSAQGLTKPVIRLDLAAAADALFSYLPSDQAY